jgi:hypothetical protein
MRPFTVCALAICSLTGMASAQLRPGTLLEDGRIVVKIFVTMPDPSISAGLPIPHVRLLLASQENRYTVATDGAGTATTFALPGAYRVATLDSVDWGGRRYRWDLEIDVRPGMAVIDLTPENAASAASVMVPDIDRRPGTVASGAGFVRKDPGTAQLLSFLITGAGQMYAGEAGKGLSLLTLSTFTGVLGLLAIADVENDGDALGVGLLGTSVGLWIYSIADADDAVDRWNTRAGLAERTRPIISAGDGAFLLGASLAF